MFLSGIIGHLYRRSDKRIGTDIFRFAATQSGFSFRDWICGGDFLENIYKTIIKKPSLYAFPEDLFKK